MHTCSSWNAVHAATGAHLQVPGRRPELQWLEAYCADDGCGCRYAGRWLSAMIYDDGPPDSFKMVLGIADGSTYSDARPTWLSPKSYQDICYVADAKNPAGDVAAMVRCAMRQHTARTPQHTTHFAKCRASA